jgi:hypothetical protein
MLGVGDIFEQTPESVSRTKGKKITKVIGLTIQEIFITGRNPTLTVALTCSKFLAPAMTRQLKTLYRKKRRTDDCHGCKVDCGWVNWLMVESYLYSELAQSTERLINHKCKKGGQIQRHC